MSNKRRRYSYEEKEQIVDKYRDKFGELPPTPIGFSVGPIIDLMEDAIKRDKPLKWEEYENRFHYRKDVTY